MCDAYRGETRVESECERGDGLVFLFGRSHCVPADLFMYARQPTLCVATWTHQQQAANTAPVNVRYISRSGVSKDSRLKAKARTKD